MQVCTTDIDIMVPKNIEGTYDKDGNYKKDLLSTDISKFMVCPEGGIKIPVDTVFTTLPKYIPAESVNRYVDWTVGDTSILSISSLKVSEGPNREENINKHQINRCEINSKATNCLLNARVTAKKVGTTTVNVKTTRGQTASCKVEVFDGNVDSVDCEDLTINYGASGVMKSNYSPKNATKTDFKWSIRDTTIATINANSGAVTAKTSGSTTVTITAPNGKTGTCTLKVKDKPGGGGNSYSYNVGSCSYTWPNEKVRYETIYSFKKYEVCDRLIMDSICVESHTEYLSYNYITAQYSNVTYGGNKEAKISYTGTCEGGNRMQHIWYYCVIKRTSNVDNPGQSASIYLSQGPSVHLSC